MINRRPVGYHQLAEILREEITSGKRKPGSRMPSETDLVQAYGCAYLTVQRAVGVLREEGLVVVQHGFPTRVAVHPERTVVLQELGSDLIIRRATEDECRSMALSRGTFVAILTSADGVSEIYVAEAHIFRPV